MGGNPVETKVEVPNVTDVLAAAAGAPTPPPKKAGLWTKFWHYRKLAMIIGGSGITLGGAGYGYKHFTATPPKANAEVAAVTPKPEEPSKLPSTVKDDPWANLPPVTPVKNETPTIPDVKSSDVTVPEIKMPVIKPPTPGPDTKKPEKVVDDPLLVIPPPPNPDTKKPTKTDDPPPLVSPPNISLPATDKKKAAGDDNTFKATGPLTTDQTKPPLPTGPAPLPSDVTEKKEKPSSGPVINIGATDPMPPTPTIPDVPVIAPPGAPATKKEEPAAAPKIKSIDIDVPSITAPDTKKDALPPLNPPETAKNTNPPITVPGPSKSDPPVVVPGPGKVTVPEVKAPDVPTIKIPDGPMADPPVATPKPPVTSDPPGIPTLTIPDATSPPVGVPAPPVKKDNYEEDWHTWKTGDTFTLISQEFLHDAKYAAALEAYNKDRGKNGGIIRVPPPYVLEEQFPHLINKSEKSDKPEPPAAKPGDGLRFEPAAPIPSAGRSAPAPAVPTAAPRDQYRVTAEAGETIREVARKTLGDSNLWWKLGELNPSIDPSRPIPVGTALKLPK